MQLSPVPSLSPSFDSYSSGTMAEIAARVVGEFEAERRKKAEPDRVFEFGNEESEMKVDEKDGEEEDFEFSFVPVGTDSAPISADQIFCNGQIRPVFPLFNRDLLLGCDVEVKNSGSGKPPVPSTVRLPLRKFFDEDRDSMSYSSSEADELDGVTPGTYCVWTPKATTPVESSQSPRRGRCKKSNSTGSSKRWKFRDLLYRSNSDGKDTFIFLAHSNSNAKKRNEKAEKDGAKAPTTKASNVDETVKAKGVAGGEDLAQYMKSKGKKESDNRRRLFLPYRQDLFGFFANVNGVSRNIHPF